MTRLSLAELRLCLPNKWGTMPTMSEDWAALAQAVSDRRTQLRLSQEDIGRAGGPSDVVVSRIEHNSEPRPRGDTLHKLDEPLQWQPGSAVAILNGGQPTPIEEVPPPPQSLDTIPIDDLLEEIRRRVVYGPGASEVGDRPQRWSTANWRRAEPPEDAGDISDRLPRLGQG
jgi:hypothetical protein